MAFNWDDYSESKAPNPSSGGFNWNDHPEVPDTSPEASGPAAAATGLINGATLNLSPRIGAVGKTAMDAITGVNGPLAGGSVQDLIDEYNSQHEKLQSDFAKAARAHPKISMAANMAGGVAGLSPLGASAMSAPGLAATGAVAGAGASPNLASPDALKNAAMGAGANVVGGKAIEAAAPLVGGAIKSGINKIYESLGGTAENLALKATGATGAQAAKFSDDTGRELLDRGIVGFWDSPGDIAAKANQAMEESGQSISDTLNNKLQGTTVDRNTVISYLKQKLASLAGDDSKTGLVKQLESKISNIEDQVTPGLTEETTNSSIPIAQAEQIKRGYQSNANWMNPEANEADKIVSGAYKQSVEDAATEASPELADQFMADKKTFGLLNPVKEAAEKRASTLNQSPFGGLLDAASTGVGATLGHAIGGPVGTVVGGAAGYGAKVLRPRIASAGAVSADKLSQVLAATPGAFGKYAGVLKSAAARGGVSLGATDYILQQSNPEYRDQRNKVFNPELQDRQLSSEGQ